MSTFARLAVLVLLAVALCLAAPAVAVNGGYTLVGWNNLGMHCMDPDYSVFALLPPYNVIYAQLMDPAGHLVTDPAGITVTYRAVADPSGSTNTTSAGKTNFWTHAQALFGASPAVDMGLAGYGMPGAANTPQPMTFLAANAWFNAEGIPLTPTDDAGNFNPYPMMRLVARDAQGAELARTDIVLPVSDEMHCSTCHATGGDPGAQPVAGWVDLPDPVRDYRLNILRLHDERRTTSLVYPSALAAAGYNAGGLYVTVTADGKAVLCAKCHASNALAAAGYPGVPALTRSLHTRHANVMDDATGMPLDQVADRGACYTCHPGSVTRCLRGAMGGAVAADGSLGIQCQGCHGNMTAVGAVDRAGWLDEPTCQSCHTGTATANAGALRYTSVFGASGQTRPAVTATFATNPNAPAAGLSLYRFSFEHGNLACEACHGSTHAEWPALDANDNLQTIALQGHVGPLAECTTCHNGQPSTTNGGPHGLHPLGQVWVNGHKDAARANLAACEACHGADSRGTVLSRASADRTLTIEDNRTTTLWRGFVVGCYNCHNGPTDGIATANQPPEATPTSATTFRNVSVAIPLQASDPDGNSVSLWIVSQPSHGTVGLAGATATYLPERDWVGSEAFAFAAWDGSTSSNLAAVTVTVTDPSCTTDVAAPAALDGVTGAALAFSATVTTTCPGEVVYDWDFGDGSAHSSETAPSHAYATAGMYMYQVMVTVAGGDTMAGGQVTVVDAPPSSQYYLFVAHTPGRLGTVWTSDLALVDISGAGAQVTLSFLGNAGEVQRSATLAPYGQVEWSDAVATLFGLSGDVQGPVAVVSSAPIAITSRIATPFGGGTMGQSFPAACAADAIAPGAEGYLPQLWADAEFRTNLGLVNASDVDGTVTVTLLGPDGAQLGQALTELVPARGWVQLDNVFERAGAGATHLGAAKLTVTGEGAKVWAYASVVDNTTGDPTTVLMQRR